MLGRQLFNLFLILVEVLQNKLSFFLNCRIALYFKFHVLVSFCQYNYFFFQGAAPGNVAESVILERESESTVMFVEGAKNAYAGHLTLKFSPDVTSTVPHHKHYCLEVGENCSPTIDHCIIRSTSVGKMSILFFIRFGSLKEIIVFDFWNSIVCVEAAVNLYNCSIIL